MFFSRNLLRIASRGACADKGHRIIYCIVLQFRAIYKYKKFYQKKLTIPENPLILYPLHFEIVIRRFLESTFFTLLADVIELQDDHHNRHHLGLLWSSRNTLRQGNLANILNALVHFKIKYKLFTHFFFQNRRSKNIRKHY